MHPNSLRLIIQTSIILLISVALVTAQASCNIDIDDVMSQVESVCISIDDNQVCYGNFEVNTIAQANAPTQDFSEQGDLADVAYIRSLYLSGLNPDTETWGIAQMRLVTPTATGNQDINLLLFGDIEVENAVEETISFDVTVNDSAANVRNSPRSTALVLASIPSGENIEAVGRLEDNSWLRVNLGDDGIGWVASFLVSPADEDNNLEDLAVQESSTPYFGAMQAFYFTDGGTSQCGNLNADGLLIQTPEGSARVTLLINEVSIELIPGANGSTALVSGNAIDGMTVSVIDGEAVVASNGSSFFVGASEETTIPLDENLSAIGSPALPVNFDVEEMSNLPLLPLFRDGSIPIVPLITGNNGSIGNDGSGSGTNTNSDTGSGSNSNANGNGNGNGNANGNANGNSNGNKNGNGN